MSGGDELWSGQRRGDRLSLSGGKLPGSRGVGSVHVVCGGELLGDERVGRLHVMCGRELLGGGGVGRVHVVCGGELRGGSGVHGVYVVCGGELLEGRCVELHVVCGGELHFVPWIRSLRSLPRWDVLGRCRFFEMPEMFGWILS